MESASPEDLVKRFETLLRLKENEFLAYAQSLMSPQMRSTIDPEDVLQEARIAAFRSLPSFTPSREIDGSLIAWFRAMVRNRVIEQARRVGHLRAEKAGPMERLESDLLRSTAANIESPSREVSREDAKKLLAQAIQELTVDEQTAIHLYYFEQLPIEIVASSLGRSKDGTKKLLERARVKLREILGRSSLFSLGPKKPVRK